jgi:hypothetical protein
MSKIAHAAVVSLLVPSAALSAQQSSTTVQRIEANPTSIIMQAGDSVPLSVVAYDVSGNVVRGAGFRIAAPRSALQIRNGSVKALEAGEYQIVVSAVLPPDANRQPPMVTIPVLVNWPPVERIELAAQPGRLYQGTSIHHRAEALHADGSRRPQAEFTWTSSNPTIAAIDAFGTARARGTGHVTITATFEGVTTDVDYDVAAFPADRLEISGGDIEVRTGDVQTFAATAHDSDGRIVEDLPLMWTHAYQPAEGVVAPAAPGQLIDGKMVADVPGVYTVKVSAGPLTDEKSFRVVQRDVIRRVDIVGHGRQNTHYTSDFWIFEGVDGRDYALTGARQAGSHAFVWDVTDPSNIHKTDSIQVDARSVNDVKVSPDGRYGVISREGASNRRNGVVILDLATPAHPTIASIYDSGLTGGVHNVFATDEYLFALSAGDKYMILDMADITNPTYVSQYNHPNSRVHDVWVHDGIAYSAEWNTGVVVVDVGNGRWGGSIDNPVLVTTFKLPSTATHAVFPYYQESTETFYLFVGDEIVSRRGLAWEGNGPDHRQAYDPETGKGGYPRATSGYIQIVDFTDPENPQMVARYEVTEYGTHNMWVEDDVLYQAYYEGGMRLVDVSGELMGNLYTQGREISVYKANDPLGWIPNAPAAWSVMPYKGHIFFSDINSGLWSVKLQSKERPAI